jgi:hypothetical protein
LKEDVEWREPFEGYVYCRTRDFGGAVSSFQRYKPLELTVLK